MYAGLIVVGCWAGSYVITLFMTLAEKLAKNTSNNLDDKLIRAAKLPIRYLSVAIGLYWASKYYGADWEWYGVTPDKVFLILLIIIVSFTASRLVKVLMAWHSAKDTTRKFQQTAFYFMRKMVSVVIYLIALMIILQQLGIEIGPLLAGMGVAGIAIALGLQEPLSNLFSALFLVMDKSINIGDWVELEDGTKAYIEDISWRSVRIRTRSGNTVIVPNSVFINEKISSYDYPESPYYIQLRVGVAYDSDLELVEKVAAASTERIMHDLDISRDDNKPRVRFREFADSSINLDIRFKIGRARDEGRIKHFLIKQIMEDFGKNNIEIPFPQRVIHKA